MPIGEAIGSRRAWGEAFWTARDLSQANQPDIIDFEALYARELRADLQRQIIVGEGN